MVAAGAFAPGHLGELTQIVPFEMVDAALAETNAVQHRVRDLPSRVVVYLLLAATLFADLGYTQVWARMIAGLAGHGGPPVAVPTAAALAQARRRVGAGPLRALFGLLRGPAAGLAVQGVRWRGLLVTAVDGTILGCPDTPANLAVYSRGGSGNGATGFPLVRVLALVACGSRTVVDAVFGTDRIRGDQLRPPAPAGLSPRDDRARRPQLRRPRPARRPSPRPGLTCWSGSKIGRAGRNCRSVASWAPAATCRASAPCRCGSSPPPSP